MPQALQGVQATQCLLGFGAVLRPSVTHAGTSQVHNQEMGTSPVFSCLSLDQG